MVKLKNCPCCGGKANTSILADAYLPRITERYASVVIRCGACGLELKYDKCKTSKEPILNQVKMECVKRWNRRND